MDYIIFIHLVNRSIYDYFSFSFTMWAGKGLIYLMKWIQVCYHYMQAPHLHTIWNIYDTLLVHYIYENKL
jgi:hypothetical protein